MLLTLALAAVFQAPAAPALDTIPTSWHVRGEIYGFPVDQVCTFSQSEAALAGSCLTSEGYEVPISGQVRQDTVSFEHAGEYEGEPLTVTYTWVVSAAPEMHGSIHVRPFDVTGEFTARPAPAAGEGAAQP